MQTMWIVTLIISHEAESLESISEGRRDDIGDAKTSNVGTNQDFKLWECRALLGPYRVSAAKQTISKLAIQTRWYEYNSVIIHDYKCASVRFKYCRHCYVR